jgi:hypothetical protein
MTNMFSFRSGDKLRALLLILIAIVLADQARFLFFYPVPDTGMWFGDESWTMLTVRALARTGVARVPEALGSSLAHSNGLVNGCIWLSGLIYGVPAAVLSTIANPVPIGRTITLTVSFMTLYVIYKLSRRLGASVDASLICVFVLVISNAFYFSSHSARLDALTGLAVLLYLYLLVSIFERSETGGSLTRWAFFLPLIAVLTLTIYVHVPTLIILPLLYSSWRLRLFHSLRTASLFLLGAIAGLVAIVGIYGISTRIMGDAGSLDLLGKGYNQYYNVANSLPVLHLLSWRVQKINTFDRFLQVWDVAAPILIGLAIGVTVRLWKRVTLSPKEGFFFANAVLLLFGWILFGGPAVFYNIHILPTAAVCCAVLLAPAFQFLPVRNIGALAPLLVLVVVFVIVAQEQKGTVGERLVHGNKEAIVSLTNPIASSENPPLILTDEPAEHILAGEPNVRLMTNHLLLFGEENKPLPDIFREHHVDYLLLYSGAHWRSPFLQIADSLYTFAGERVGTFTDLGRTYDAPHWNEFDTLRLYKAK